MYRKFLNARSPLRLLERGLHGGLGRGNLGVVLAGRGVGKTSFLVDLALDELLRGEHVLHVALDQTVSHVKAYYDTLFEELASTSHLEDIAVVHAEIARKRRIRAYPQGGFSPARLREAVKVETEIGAKPALVVIEGYEFEPVSRDEVAELRSLAGELQAEIWLSAVCAGEAVRDLPGGLARVEDLVSVILALEPGPEHVALRALKDHDNPDVEELHVALDPRTLLLVRS